jgi:hypothetical protein
MNPKDIRIRLQESRLYEDGVRKATSRTWPLDPTDPPEKGNGALVDGQVRWWTLWVNLYVVYWGSEENPPMVSGSIGGSAHGYSNDIRCLSARSLRRLAAMIQVYEDWFAGKIPELPIECPAEILAIT